MYGISKDSQRPPRSKLTRNVSNVAMLIPEIEAHDIAYQHHQQQH